jgi:RNA polymerase subunit RPABC4/transcription elongation factor Spt4
MPYSSWSDSPIEDFEYPDEADRDDDFDESYTTSCPECGETIYEDTPSCPHCGNYLTFSTSFWSGQSAMWIGVGMVGILAVILVLVLG